MAILKNQDFESGTFPWGWQNYEYPVGFNTRMIRSTDQARVGTNSLKIHLNSTDPQAQNGSRRVELTQFNNQSTVITARWYGFSWYFPSATMPFDSRECVIIQWHDRAVPPNSCSASPFLAIEAKNDRFRAMIRYKTSGNYCPSGALTLVTFDLGPIIKDAWLDCVIFYRPSFSTSTDPNNPASGRAQIWLYQAGTPPDLVLDYTGPCFTAGSYDPYLKWGVYKWLWTGAVVTPGSLTFFGDTWKIGDVNENFSTVAPPSAGNTPPIVSAGANQVHPSATTSTTLTGTASDPGGSIASTLWTRVSGPNTPTIVSASSLSTSVTGMIPGTYVFRITATDNLGATSTATVQVRINSLPTIDLSGNTTSYPPGTTSINLVSSSTDPDGVIVSRQWTQIAGPNNSSITSPTSANTGVTGMTQGVYMFRYSVSDNDGEIVLDEIQITIALQLIILGRPKKRFIEI